MSMLALTKEHLSDRQQEELKRLAFQKLKTDSNAQYRGKQLGDDYYQIVISNRTELVYRFNWRQIVELMPWPNFPVKYVFHRKICPSEICLIWQKTIEKKASPGACARELEARLPITDAEKKALYFDGQKFLAMAGSAHRFVRQVGSLLGTPRNVATLMEHRSNDEHLLKMSFEVNIQPRILNGQFFARNDRFLLRLWDQQDAPPKFSELKLSDINSDLEELRQQLQVYARLYSFRDGITSAICQTYNLAEPGEVSAPYVIGYWRSDAAELTLKMDMAKEEVSVAITLNEDERCILLSEEFSGQKQMLDFIRSRLDFCKGELKEFRRTLMGYFSAISSRVVQVGRPMKSTGSVVLFDEIMVMGAFSDPFFLRFSYNFGTSLYECRSSMGAIDALTADQIGSIVSEHVDHYLIFDGDCVPARLRDTLVTVRKAKPNSESLLTIKHELCSYDLLYLVDIKITKRGMYLEDQKVAVPKCSGSSTSFESIPLNEFLDGNSKLLIVRSQKPTAGEESSILSRLSEKVLTKDPEVAMNTLRWQISSQLSLVFYSKLQSVYE